MTAESGATFQLPEASVGLFPANGIATVIAPKIGYSLARRLVLDGEKLDTKTALAAGIIDEVYEPGRGEAGVRALVARLTPSHAAHVAFERTIQRQHNITLDALIAETDYWAKTVRHLPASSLERMRRIGMLQRRMFGPAGGSSSEDTAARGPRQLAAKPGDAAIVNRGRLRSIVGACPDGCGEHITVNLDDKGGPV